MPKKKKTKKKGAEYYAEAFGIGGKATKKEIKKIMEIPEPNLRDYFDFSDTKAPVNGKLRMHVFSGKNYWDMARSFNEFFEKKDVELKEFHFVQSVSHDGFWIEDSVTVIAVFVLY